jgi:hypothetical protein
MESRVAMRLVSAMPSTRFGMPPPKAKVLLGDKGYDAGWFRTARGEREIIPCTPSKANRKVPIPYDPALYRLRYKIENMLGRLKD